MCVTVCAWLYMCVCDCVCVAVCVCDRVRVPACQAAPYIGQLEAAQVKEFIKKLNSPTFLAPNALLAAMARCHPESNQPVGLMKVTGEGVSLREGEAGKVVCRGKVCIHNAV